MNNPNQFTSQQGQEVTMITAILSSTWFQRLCWQSKEVRARSERLFGSSIVGKMLAPLRKVAEWAGITESQEVLRSFVAMETSDHPSPLFEAVRTGNIEAAEQFISWGADVSCHHAGVTPQGDCFDAMQALEVAIANADRDMVALLLKHGANPCDFQMDQSPLYQALSKRRYPIAELLLDHGAYKGLNAVDRAHITHLMSGDQGTEQLLTRYLLRKPDLSKF